MKSYILSIKPFLAIPFGRFLFSFSLFFIPLSSFYSTSNYTSPFLKSFFLPDMQSEVSDPSSLFSKVIDSQKDAIEFIADNWEPGNSHRPQLPLQHAFTTSTLNSSSIPSIIKNHFQGKQSAALREISANKQLPVYSTAIRQQNQNPPSSVSNTLEARSFPQNAREPACPSAESVVNPASTTKAIIPPMGSSHSDDSFVSQKKERRAYLATYPRSGNHWMRYLVEEATHIATSSVMCDFNPQHLKTPFEWGGYCPENGYEGHCRYPEENETVLIKTHVPALPPREFDQQPYFATIRIIRHPVDSFYSYYVFNQGLRTMHNIAEPLVLDADLINHFIETWRAFQEYWDEQPNVLTLRYEDMLESPGPILKLILRTLDYDDSNENVERAIAKYPPEGKPLKHLSQFTKEELELINDSLGDLLERYDYTIPLPKPTTFSVFH